MDGFFPTFVVMEFPNKLAKKSRLRKENKAFRSLGVANSLIDFSSNDYLGFAKSETIFDVTHQYLIAQNSKVNGATGSRLLSGNHNLYELVEKQLADVHQSEAALVFNSGYDANIGFFSSVPQRGDVILYDEFIHASIRDGIQISNAKAYKFKHNNLADLSTLLERHSNGTDSPDEVYVVTEAVFSMDGDSPDLIAMSQMTEEYNAFFVVDEAHSVGVFGKNGVGKVQKLGLEKKVFARIVTFGKAMGCHGAVVLGSYELKAYLINFARSLIYTTGLAPHALATIKIAYDFLINRDNEVRFAQQKLRDNITFFRSEITRLALASVFVNSTSAIHCCVIPGTLKAKSISQGLQEKGFDVKAILAPTVALGHERLRFCLHTYNSKEEMTKVLEILRNFVIE